MSKTKLRFLSISLLDREERDVTESLTHILDQFEAHLHMDALIEAKAFLNVFIRKLSLIVSSGKIHPFVGNILLVEAIKTRCIIEAKENR